MPLKMYDECLNVCYIFTSMMHAKCMHVNNFFYASKLENDAQKYKLIKQLFLFCFVFFFFSFLYKKFLGIHLLF